MSLQTGAMRYARRAVLEPLGYVMPNASADWFERYFLTPSRRPRPDQAALPPGRRHRVPYGSGWLSVHEWGEGPVVLLLHGWSGGAADFTATIGALSVAGFRVVAYDAPAHGDSGGRQTNLVDCMGAVLQVAGRVGPVWAVVGHSFGAQVGALAANHGLDIRRLGMIGPPADLRALTLARAARLGVPLRIVDRALERLARRLDVSWPDLLTARLVSTLDLPLLVVHDRDDTHVPYAHGEQIAAAGRNARLLTTTGLGHHGVLLDDAVHVELMEFLKPD